MSGDAGIEPRAFHMQSERSTTELHPHDWLKNVIYMSHKNNNYKSTRYINKCSKSKLQDDIVDMPFLIILSS